MGNQISTLFNNTPLYCKKTFNLLKTQDGKQYTNYEKLKELNDYLGLKSTNKLISKCLFCGMDEIPFDLEISTIKTFDSLSLFNCSNIFSNFYACWSLKENEPFSGDSYVVTAINKEPSFCVLRYVFRCTNVKSHFYFMDLLLVAQNGIVEVTKIGQYPESTLLVVDKNEKRYVNILNNLDAYDDYRNANKSNQYGLCVGAFDYERRILEKLISYFLIKNNFDELNNKDTKFDKKYDAIKEEFSPEIKQLIKPLYQALSGGVHFMADNECSEYYIDLKYIIDMQLEYMFNKDAQDKAIASSASTLEKLQNKYNK